ncbi:putative Disease resistance protein [Melia azedarach]|uniref:Disease resistance protein n=1 Tax=Melia azedarach TaxID=155640 RepID=A0ACC1XNC3_MELAZ|nr:putative Disease resistance protein [Melia azedarach]
MTNLRLLKIYNVQLPEGLEYLSNKLRLLEWQECPLKSLPSNFQMEKTLELDICFSNIERLWQGMKHFKMLKVMRLSHCQNLIETPDFTGLSNLQELILTRCQRLQEIHPSLLVHKKLVVLDMKDCTSLKILPKKIGMNSLKKLVLSGCLKLENFPEIESRMECLSELLLDGTAIIELPLSIELLSGLVFLSLNDSKNLKVLPGTIGCLKSLKTLNLSGCWKLKKFPRPVGSMECLSKLILDRSAIIELPPSIKFMPGLILLSLKGCKNLKTLPNTLSGLKCLKTLNVSGCLKLKKFPEIVERMECLSELFLDGTAIEELPLSVELLSGLVLLNLNNCNNLVRLPSTINGLKSLKTLNLSSCSKLKNVPENLGKVESLEELDVSGTAIRQPISSIFLLKNLKTLSFRGCKGPPASTSCFSCFLIFVNLARSSNPMGLVLPSLSALSSLTKLDLSDCNIGEGAIPSDLCNLLSLEELNLSKNNFVSLPRTINHLSELKNLKLEDCKRLESLPELPSSIWMVRLAGCASLESVSEACKHCKLWHIDCINCLKLVGNSNLVFSMLKRFLEAESNSGSWFNICVPGGKIPEWFRYQNEGSSIKIIRPPNSKYNKNKLVGYAICCVFDVHKHPPTIKSSSILSTHILNSFMEADNFGYYIDFDEELGQPVPDHLWLFYLSNQELVSFRVEF